MEPSELDVTRLFFDLASDDRLVLLGELGAGSQRVTKLAAKISASTQETSKHLSRLQESRLVDRGSDGTFSLTAIGKTIVQLLPPFRLLVEHEGYFLGHDLSHLPAGFVGRLGELSSCTFARYTGEVLGFYERVVEEAGDHIWVMMDHQLRTNSEIVEALSERRVAIRYMVPESDDVRRDYEEAKAILGDLLEVRLNGSVPASVLMDEKVAGIAFADLTGKIDYNTGFWSTDARFRRWCADLFQFHWERARTLSPPRSAPVTSMGYALAGDPPET